MKLITWNIQWGLGMDGRLDLARMVAEARRIADFDVLCLQEVADGFSDLDQHDGGNQFAEIAALLPEYEAIEGIAVDLPGEGGRRQRFGNMILSRLPVGRIIRHALPWPADPAARSMPRLLLEAEVHAAFGSVRVMTTHLEYHSAPLRSAQVATIREIYRLAGSRARQPPRPGSGPYAGGQGPAATILTGDFNMRPDDPVKRSLSALPPDSIPGLADAWEALHPGVAHPPSFCIGDQKYGPPHCCDYVFVSDDLTSRLRRIEYETITRVSDHQPLFVCLQ
jgi:endonuclease/exonuclease/phosphatase family metal-dependent hydrolase